MRLVDRFSRVLQGRIDAAADAVTVRVTADVSARVHEQLVAEMRELARMLRQQGDAADELAETFGRTLARLSVELDRLSAALDHRGGPSGPGAPDAPGRG